MQDLKQTPLFREHQDLGAQMAAFGGWLMPIQYAGILAEHKWCRESASLFDLSHMGEFYFRGDFTASGLERLFSCRLETIPIGRGRYGFLLNETGGIVDDLVVFRLSADELMLVVNAATIAKDFQAIRAGLKGQAVFTDISAETGNLGIQGPLSKVVLEEACGISVDRIPYFAFQKMEIFGTEFIVSRTGYTGELGFELYLQSDRLVEWWRRFLADVRVKPAGLGARDLLRLEMGYSLYGSDLDETTTPLEAGLSQFVDFSKDFVGRDALIKQQNDGLSRTRSAFRGESRRSPRHGYLVFQGDRQVGEVTSGGFSPMLGCGIGLGYVRPEVAQPGTVLTIRHEEASMTVTVTELPFYKGGSLKSMKKAATSG